MMNQITNISTEIILTSKRYDTNAVYFYDRETHRHIGSGYQSKENNTIHIVRCPVCEKENWAVARAVGACCFCGTYVLFNLNTLMPEIKLSEIGGRRAD